MPDKLLTEHNFTFNKNDNGGEQLILNTKMYANGDVNGVYWNQELTLNSYGNSVSLNFSHALFSPDLLRKLADELETARNTAQVLTRKNRV